MLSSQVLWVGWGGWVCLLSSMFCFGTFVYIEMFDRSFYACLIDEVIKITKRNLQDVEDEIERMLNLKDGRMEGKIIVGEGFEGYDIYNVMPNVEVTLVCGELGDEEQWSVTGPMTGNRKGRGRDAILERKVRVEEFCRVVGYEDLNGT
jgi:hypothetical protein